MNRRFFKGMLCLVFLGVLLNPAFPQREPHPLFEPADPSLFKGYPNLFLGARVTASGQWSDRVPELAVDGKHENNDAYWAAENIPVWLTVDMGESREINTLRVWPYWENGRFYQYKIEGSLDNEEWLVLMDRSQNDRPATAEGEIANFASKQVRYVRFTFTHNSKGNDRGGHLVELEGYRIPPGILESERLRASAWAELDHGLQGSFASVDQRYPRNKAPVVEESKQWSGVAWRGERLNAKILLWSSEVMRQLRLVPGPLVNEEGESLGEDSMRPFFVRYVSAEGRVTPDVLDTIPRLDMAARSTRPVWITIQIPGDAKPGVYQGTLMVEATRDVSLPFDFQVEVLPLNIPSPEKWSFHLDLWQNPFSVARYHKVKPWSPEHFQLLEPYLRLLADAGQKCLTVSIIHQPWGGQTFDPFESMIQWIRSGDGSWAFDYEIFDRYVEFARACGIKPWINCYSMVPWTNKVRYLDEAAGDFQEITAEPGEPAFEELWGAFLPAFATHLEEKGWLGETAIAMDERPLKLMEPTIELVRQKAPELKIALAGSNEPGFKDSIDDWCVYIAPPLDPALARERRERNVPTTFYVCCVPERPNTFTYSPPAEAAWLGLYAAAQDYSGFLRWAYNSWVEEPLLDTKHVTWAAGDCFLVYPGPRSSIRFERLREGIQDYEKIRILRIMATGSERTGIQTALEGLEAALKNLTYDAATKEPASQFVNEVKGALERLSRTFSY